jgi:hypothetical protein
MLLGHLGAEIIKIEPPSGLRLVVPTGIEPVLS